MAIDRKPFCKPYPFIGIRIVESEDQYMRAIRGYAASLWRGSITQFDFIDAMVTAISYYLTKAWNEGALAAGVTPDEMTEDEISARTDMVNGQYNHIIGLSEYIMTNNRDTGALLRSLFPRLELWSSRYSEAYMKGMVMANLDEKQIWVLGNSKKHCSSCASLAGQVRRGSFWMAHIQPRDQRLECNGYRCNCDLIRTNAPISRGRLPGGF